ncbi:MAG: Hsp20/alpha crystallin family protein [Betaproteobacteria bacterium]|nr:Hsp20/alpha crystallin family protein [Betaproteobacteria bacterium]
MEAVGNAPRSKLDLHELDTSYTVKAENPRRAKEDIDVRVDGNTVTISAEVKKEKGREEGKAVCCAARGRKAMLQPQFHAGLPGERGRVKRSHGERCTLADAPKKAARSKKRLSVHGRAGLGGDCGYSPHDPTAVRPRSSVHRGRPNSADEAFQFRVVPQRG